MNRIIVIEFVTLDGVVEDPDGSSGTPFGGWAFRYGPEAVAGDKFKLGETLDRGALLLGRSTWEQFTKLWPGRTDPFSTRMNNAPKLVASRSLTDAGAWANSTVIDGDLITEVPRLRERQDLIVIGSTVVVDALREHDLIDEYRLLIFPTVVGSGRRLFAPAAAPENLRMVSAELNGAALLVRYERAE